MLAHPVFPYQSLPAAREEACYMCITYSALGDNIQLHFSSCKYNIAFPFFLNKISFYMYILKTHLLMGI